MAGVTVNIYVDGSFVTSTTTNSNGYYSRSISIGTLGSHTLRATGAGASASRTILITYTLSPIIGPPPPPGEAAFPWVLIPQAAAALALILL